MRFLLIILGTAILMTSCSSSEKKAEEIAMSCLIDKIPKGVEATKFTEQYLIKNSYISKWDKPNIINLIT
ncbi:MAG: hypothetical protein JKY53_06705 [Flavobacteriales bacterium]|nr:hypothetical protein [Flavobacteriales bacterium]